uniref:GAGA-binding transcriptional activator n=1 Tax=Leersia perrieri TaxID=77586 RepID=A0A0D9WLD5_9ORYZ
MDNLGHRENGRQRPDQYKGLHTQWMMPQTQRHLKDHQSMNLLALMNDRDNAIRERDHALAEKKAAIAERDMAFAQRDAAMAERNAAVVERDNALAALELARTNGLNMNNGNGYPQGSLNGSKNIHHHDQLSHAQASPLQLADSPYDHAREMHISEAYPISTAPGSVGKAKRPKKNSSQASPLKRPSGVLRKTKKPSSDWKNVGMSDCGDDSANASVMKNDWKDKDLGLNQVAFDESTMPAPACSCTGKLRQCYKWGNGGWQSSCCTMNISMYPLPVIPNKRHARMGGRKMSGGAFTKLLSRLAAEGHDLSTPVDLKDHWAKHGTNRYITIR